MTPYGTLDDNPVVPLFDGVSLSGWRTAPGIYGSLYPGGPSVLEMFEQDGRELPVEPEKHPARWFVEDGSGQLTGFVADNPETSVEPVTATGEAAA